MSIKDNFSQAVKELWKKDGMEESTETPAAPQANPSQLDQYLAQQEEQTAATAPAAPAQTGQSPAQPAQTAQQPAVNTATTQLPPVQPTAPAANNDINAAGVPLETPYYRTQTAQTQTAQPAQQPTFNANTQPAQTVQPAATQANIAGAASAQGGFGGGFGANQGYGNANNGGFGGGFVPPASGNVNANRAAGVTDEVTVISKNTVIDGNVRSLANMQVDGNIKGNVDTTRDIEMTGKVVGDIKCNNANMNSAAMQGNLTIKGKMRMDRDTILIGDLTSQYADVNGRIRGKLEIAGKAELKRDAIVFGDINASTIAVTDGAIIQGYVNTTFLSKEDSRNAFPEAISLDTGKDVGVK